jgi:hypothetical protein
LTIQLFGAQLRYGVAESEDEFKIFTCKDVPPERLYICPNARYDICCVQSTASDRILNFNDEPLNSKLVLRWEILAPPGNAVWEAPPFVAELGGAFWQAFPVSDWE